MKILVTGANGYVGSEIVVELAARGHEVWCTARASAPRPAAPHAGLVVHDWTQPLHDAPTDFDLVVHAAGGNDVVSARPDDALRATVLTTRFAAEFAARQASPRLLYVSTFQVYGIDEGPVDESTPCRPINDYAFTHHMAEQWIESVSRRSGLRYVHARPANIAGLPSVGSMARWTLVPGCFCLDAVRGGRIIVRSTGKQQRDFLSVSDVAARVAGVCEVFDRFANGCVNICSGTAITVGEIAAMARDRAQRLRPCSLEFAPPATTSPPPDPLPLRVASRYFELHPQARMSAEDGRRMLNACIDQTLQYLHLKEAT